MVLHINIKRIRKRIRVNAVCPVLIKTPGLIKALNGDESPSSKNMVLLTF